MKRSISRKLLLRLILFTVALAICFCLLITAVYTRRVNERYEYVGASLTSSLSDVIDGDRAVGYLKTMEKDSYYLYIRDVVMELDKSFGSQAVYIVVADDKQIQYIWSDTDPGGTALGYVEIITPNEQAWMYNMMNDQPVPSMMYFDDPTYGHLATVCTPIRNSEKKVTALALVDFDANQISGAILRIVLMSVGIVTLLTIIYILLFYRYVRHNIIQPIQNLTGATAEITDNLDSGKVFHADIHSGDELETLSKSFEKMDGDLRHYIEDNERITEEKGRITAELNLASAIQHGQLPQVFPAFPDRRDLDIYASMTPAKTVGGDLYDFYLVDDSHLAMVIADVSGKGIPASLFMMISRILIKNHVKAGESPATALTSVNTQLMENNKTNQFVTVWLAVLDLETGKGMAANAGHEHPALCRAGGRYELVTYKHSPPVAITDFTVFREHSFEMFPGDSLFVYTDGVTEATDAHEELFGTDRMLEALNKEPDALPEQVTQNVMEGIRLFVGEAEQFDDITMLAFRYNGPEKA